jgi:hypothetical protein
MHISEIFNEIPLYVSQKLTHGFGLVCWVCNIKRTLIKIIGFQYFENGMLITALIFMGIASDQLLFTSKKLIKFDVFHIVCKTNLFMCAVRDVTISLPLLQTN